MFLVATSSCQAAAGALASATAGTSWRPG